MVSEYIASLLDDIGYTFHEERGVHWYVWGFPSGSCDYETGPDCRSIEDARATALIHFLRNAVILTVEQEGALAREGWRL